MSLSKREKACRELNRDIYRALNARDYALENGEDVGSKISLPSTSKVPYSPFWGSVHFGIVEHCLVLDTKDNNPHVGEWLREEKVVTEKQVCDLFTQDITTVRTVKKSLQSPENTAANNRKWTQRAKAVSKEARKNKVVITGAMVQRMSKSDKAIMHTEHLHDANEKSANDYRSYFR